MEGPDSDGMVLGERGFLLSPSLCLPGLLLDLEGCNVGLSLSDTQTGETSPP